MVFPLDPVIPAIGAAQSWKKSLVSLSSGTCRVRAAFRIGASRGTPGLT